jgi:hypothetical protein
VAIVIASGLLVWRYGHFGTGGGAASCFFPLTAFFLPSLEQCAIVYQEANSLESEQKRAM